MALSYALPHSGNNVKRIVGFGLLFVSTASAALECGPSITAATLDQLQAAVTAANNRLLQHSSSLFEEAARLVSAAKSDADLSASDKVSNEGGRIDNAYANGERVREGLENTWLL